MTTIDDFKIEKIDVIKNHKVVSEEWVRKDELRKLITESVRKLDKEIKLIIEMNNELDSFNLLDREKIDDNNWEKGQLARVKEFIIELMPSVKEELEK